MQYEKSLKSSKLVSLYDNVQFIFECFMTYNMPCSAKKHHKSTKPESHLTTKIFFLFFRQASSQLCDSLTFMHKTAAFYTKQCTSPLLFQNIEASRGGSNRSLENYGFISNANFNKPVCMHTNHLATKPFFI